jgi:hypothetical protein
MRASYIFSLATLLAPILCGKPIFEICDADEIDSLTAALEDVQKLSKKADEQSEGGRGKFHDWFGVGGDITDEAINIRFEKFSNILESVPRGAVHFVCKSGNRCCTAGVGR